MSEPNATAPGGVDGPIEPDAIQFDQAEFADPVPGGPACGICHRAIADLFNLLPIWHLDGGRAFRSLNRSQRWLAVAAIAAAWAVTDEGLLILLLLGGVVRTVSDKPSDTPDAGVLGQYALLVWALAALSQLPVVLPR